MPAFFLSLVFGEFSLDKNLLSAGIISRNLFIIRLFDLLVQRIMEGVSLEQGNKVGRIDGCETF